MWLVSLSLLFFFQLLFNYYFVYQQMILQLSNGPCVAMEIVAKDSNTSSYPAFRNLCGPVDPVSFCLTLLFEGVWNVKLGKISCGYYEKDLGT